MMAKMEEFGGRNLPIPLIYGNPQGRSASFAQAQNRGAVTNSLIDAFTLTRVKDYSVATIDNETLEASKGNANAFMEAATTEIDGAIQALTRSLAIAMYRDGVGDIGQVGSAVAASEITLSNPNDITNFEVGMALNLCSSDKSTLQTGVAYVVKVNRSEGKLTVADVSGTPTNLSTLIATAAQGMRFVPVGDFNQKVKGLAAWNPASAPTSAPFFGVDRTVDETRLAGIRVNAAGKPIEEALIDAASVGAREGAKLDHAFLSYDKFAELEKSLGSKVQYIDLKVNAEVGFRGVQINGPRGPIRVIPDQNCPSGSAHLLQLDTWKLYSLGKAVRVIDTDGLQMLRQASADGVEVRYGFYGNVGCRAPGYNVHVIW